MRKVTMILTISITLTILFIVGFPRSGGAQQMKQQLGGAWTLVDVYFEWQDGRRTQPYGPNVKGRLWIDPTDLFGIQIIGADRPKFKSNDRREGTAEENATVVKMTETFFGTYTLNEAEQTITMQLERSIFPNWDGTVRKYRVRRRSYTFGHRILYPESAMETAQIDVRTRRLSVSYGRSPWRDYRCASKPLMEGTTCRGRSANGH